MLFHPEASAELLPIPDPGALRMTFEILPARPGHLLSPEVRRYEGGRLTTESGKAGTRHYQKTTVVFPLPDGDTRERVIFFVEQDGHTRMVGFHRIQRHQEAPQGETIVFNEGPDNPMKGRSVTVPPDTYTYLALCTALGPLAATPVPATAHLWTESKGAIAIEIAPAGTEDLEVLGTHVPSRRLQVQPADGDVAGATYWFAADTPHSFLQYRGPGDFLVNGGETAPEITLRVTSSSEQVQRLFGEPRDGR